MLLLLLLFRSNEQHPLPHLGTILLSKDQITYQDLYPTSLYLSVVIPAYNEEARLSIMLDEALEYLESRKCHYELIIVDDGSRDCTTELAQKYVLRYGSDKIRVITLQNNRGKGGAIRIGVLAARGELILFADADGATRFGDIGKLEKFIFDQQQKYVDVINNKPQLIEYIAQAFHFIFIILGGKNSKSK